MAASASGHCCWPAGSDVTSAVYTGSMLKTDGSGNVQWQNAYTGTTPYGQQFNDVIQTSDGGYAAAGSSYVGSPTNGGPGFYVVKMDSNGRIDTC